MASRKEVTDLSPRSLAAVGRLLEQLASFVAAGVDSTRDASSLDGELAPLLRVAVQTQVCLQHDTDGLEKLLGDILGAAEDIAGRVE